MASQTYVLPGDPVPTSLLPSSTAPLRLGPGLRHVPRDTITPTTAGELCVDHKKNAVWIDSNGGRYVPTQGDTILATVHHSSTDFYSCAITPHTAYALLPQLAFEGATKKTRPQLVPGSLVYARISLANKHMDAELECVNPATGKADGLGELKDGMVFDISVGMARRLMMPEPGTMGGLVVLEEVAEKIPFEVAVGRNGRIWVKSGLVAGTIAVGRAITQTDTEGLGVDEQRKLVKKLLKAL
ncbi:MAG: SM-like, degradation of cytoplasmic mRNAs and positively regulates transcription initiation [Chaenotheca gracillima]|nr:MAG: SM-like, degradation of cytoplasmic mRNAs and positively regulates transcription initiation [Chaenotheca gracillima]